MEVQTDVEIHRHCSTCIKVSKCTVRPKEGESCLIIDCPLDCGSRYHSCKQLEHSLLCSNEKRPCINADFGCSAVLPNKLRGKHLETCPASIVVCTAEWNRWPLNSKERKSNVPFSQLNPMLQHTQLDVALALRDQRMVDQWNRLPRRIKNMERNDVTPRHPALPLLSPHWTRLSLPRGTSDQTQSRGSSRDCSTPRQSVDRSEASVSSTDDESPWGRRKKPPGLLQSVFSELYDRSYPEESDEETLSDVSQELEGDGPSAPLSHLNLDISIQCLPRYKDKPKSMYTFICSGLFRRDEYSWHYLNTHSQIHGGLDGWMEQRCPLARYGCSYSRRRLHPVSSDSRLVYCEAQESFGVNLKENVAALSESDTPSFGELPFEVLRNIARYLDSFTLSRLSVTCHLMRSVCASLLDSRGLVSLQWKKTQQPAGNARWTADCKRWFFSSAFTPVSKWVYSDAEHLSNHLSSCPFNMKSDVKLPEKIPLLSLTPEYNEDQS